MNSSFARGDIKSLSRVCSEEQLKKLKERIKARPKDQTVVWQGDEGDNGEAKILSFRTVDAWNSKKPEDHCAQVLLRFDTKQVSIRYFYPRRERIYIVSFYVVCGDIWSQGEASIWGPKETRSCTRVHHHGEENVG
jgi:hypothetical protein